MDEHLTQELEDLWAPPDGIFFRLRGGEFDSGGLEQAALLLDSIEGQRRLLAAAPFNITHLVHSDFHGMAA